MFITVRKDASMEMSTLIIQDKCYGVVVLVWTTYISSIERTVETLPQQ